MSILSDTVRGVGRLLFPVRCPVCGGEMPPGSRVVCTRCRYAVPLTGFCYATYNPLWERLSAAGSRRTGFGLPLLHPRQRVARADPPLQIRRRMAPCTRYGRMVRSLPGRQRPLRHGGPDRPRAAPLAQTGLRRGYNQAEYLAEGIARALRAEVDRHSVRRIRNNPAQALHRHAERWDNVEGIFAVRCPERLAGHHLLLVDDVLTTGATLLSCAETILRAAPDCRLSVAVLAVPQRELGLDG